MDVFSQLRLSTSHMGDYAKKHNLSRLFQHLLQYIVIDRPENICEYLYHLLKVGYHDVPKVLILGDSIIDMKLACSTLTRNMRLIHLTCRNLIEFASSDVKERISKFKNILQVPAEILINLVKDRIKQADCLTSGWLLEGFPQTREQAYLFIKKGIFPTHIIIVEDSFKNANLKKSINDYTSKFNTPQLHVIADIFSHFNIRYFKSKSYAADFTSEVEEFVRRKMPDVIPEMPRILLLGPKGCGRKTIAFLLAWKFDIIQVNFEEILRQAAMIEGPLKKSLLNTLKTAGPIEDDLLAKVAAERLNRLDCKMRGWVLFGFPLNDTQAKYLIEYIQPYQVNKIIFLEVSLNICLSRFLAQNTHLDEKLNFDCCKDIEKSFANFQSNKASIISMFSSKLSEDIVNRVNAEDNIGNTFEIIENLIATNAGKRKVFKEWWQYPSRNCGIY